MECPICFNIIYKSAIPSCTHHFCYSCLKNWCLNNGTSCPICKKNIYEIKFDREFDIINNKNNINNFDMIDNFHKIYINFDKNDEAGITLENNYYKNQRRPGVKIKKLKYEKKMYDSGLRNGDIILFINNIPCLDHYNSINIINYASSNGTSIECELLK